MPSPSSRSSSSRLARAAGAERMALLREREKLTRRRDSAAAQLAATERQLAEVEERLTLIDRLVPEAANVHPLPSRAGGRAAADGTGGAADGLRGAAIRQAAIDVLLERPDPAAPVHYKDWFAALDASGRHVAGKDPLAVFLTQISRSPVVRRTNRSGVYELDLDAPARLRARLERLHTRLAEQAAVPAAPAERAERDRLVADITAAERALDEAERALARHGDASASGRRAAG